MGLFSSRTSAVNPNRPCLLGQIGEIAQQFLADALALVVVADGKGDFRRVRVRLDFILPETDEFLLVLLSDDSQDLASFSGNR